MKNECLVPNPLKSRTTGPSSSAEPASSMSEPRAAVGGPGPSGLPGRIRTLSSPPPPGRLSSLRTRDLTLGGSFKKTKKTFEPNVHAVRKSKEELKEDVKKERRERDERRREARGRRRRDKPHTIQSHSIFEQGPADSGPPGGWRAAADLQDSSSCSSFSAVCRLVKKEAEDEEDEDQILRKLQRDDFIDDPGLKNDNKLKPIRLPLSQSSSSIQTSIQSSSYTLAAGPRGSTPVGTRPPGLDKPSVGELLRRLRLSGSEELFFMQLPDCMPGRAPPDAAPAPPAEKASRRGSRPEDRKTAVVQVPTVVLSHFPEGLLGKLQIRRSGKVELKLGDVVLDVSEGAAFSFLQQLVSVRLSEGNTGDMMVLGNVLHKLVLSPDFHALLQQRSSSS